jgi:hypothetical protein
MSKELDEYRANSIKEVDFLHTKYCREVRKEFKALESVPEKELILSGIIGRLTDICLKLHFECIANRDKIQELFDRLNVRLEEGQS